MVEHFHGKEGVTSSSLVPGFREADKTADAFALALLGGDAAAATRLFARSGVFLTPDGTEVGGQRSICQVLDQLVSSDHGLRIRTGRVVDVGDVALCTQYWTRLLGGPGSSEAEVATTAKLVLARFQERWMICIAAPWGEPFG